MNQKAAGDALLPTASGRYFTVAETRYAIRTGQAPADMAHRCALGQTSPAELSWESTTARPYCAQCATARVRCQSHPSHSGGGCGFFSSTGCGSTDTGEGVARCNTCAASLLGVRGSDRQLSEARKRCRMSNRIERPAVTGWSQE